MSSASSAISSGSVGAGATPTLRMRAELLRSSLQPVSVPTLPSLPGYELLEVLGRGGMGTVYKARQRGLNRLVALKLLSDRNADDEEIARFFQEAEAIGALQHPNVVQIYEVGQHEGQPFLALEFVDGGTLHHRIEGQPQPPAFAAELCETLARAVHAVHTLHIVHRDLKPANILLHAPGSVAAEIPVAKITDFGLAKRMDTPRKLTETGIATGTPAYMAPEQVRGDRTQIGPATDIWALGAILYEMLTGRPPFQAHCPIQTMSDVLSVTPESPSRLVRGIPRDLETICLKCLEKSPARRYASALQFAEDLQRYREGRPILARRVSRTEQAWRWCARNPVVAGLIAGMTTIFAVGATVSSVYAIQADANASEAIDQKSKAEGSAQQANARQAEAIAATERANEQKAKADDLARQALERERRGVRERYALEANLALMSWQAGDIARTRRFLATAAASRPGESDLRGFEWYYLNHLCHADVGTIPLKTDQPHALAFSPDGRRFAFGRGHEFGLYDPELGILPLVFRGHSSVVTSLAWSPRNDEIASASRDGTIRIWDSKTGKQLHALRGHADEAFAVLYTPDGTLISCGGRHSGLLKPGEIIFWDVENEKPKRRIQKHEGAINCIAISRDGSLLGSGGFDAKLNLYEVDTGRLLREVQLPSHSGILSIAIHPFKQWVAAGTSDGPIAMFDPATGALLRELHGHSDWVNSLAVSADGSCLASGGIDRTVRIWDTEKGVLIRNYRGHDGTVHAVAYKSTGRHFVSVADDGVARVWDIRKKPENTFLASGDSAHLTAQLFPDGQRLFVVSEFGNTKVISIDSKSPLQMKSDPISGGNYLQQALLLPDGDTIAMVSAEYKITFRTISGRPVSPLAKKVTDGYSVSASGNGRWLAVDYHPRLLHIHDLRESTEPRAINFPANVTSHTCSAGEDPMLAAVTDAGVLRFIHLRSGASSEFSCAEREIYSGLVFSSDGSRIAGTDSRHRLHVWDVQSRQELWSCDAHTAKIQSINFSSKGDRIVTASLDRTAKVFDSATGSETIALRGHIRGVFKAMFSADGLSVITVGMDNQILKWEGAVSR